MQDEGLLDNFRGIGEYNIDLTRQAQQGTTTYLRKKAVNMWFHH